MVKSIKEENPSMEEKHCGERQDFLQHLQIRFGIVLKAPPFINRGKSSQKLFH
jgi:hypothetical protein